MKSCFILAVVFSVTSIAVLPRINEAGESVYDLATFAGNEGDRAPDHGPHPGPQGVPDVEPHLFEGVTGSTSPKDVHNALDREPSYQLKAMEDGITGAEPPKKGQPSVWYNHRTGMYEMHVGGLPDVSRAVRIRGFLKDVFKSGAEYVPGIREESYRPSVRRRALRYLGYYRMKNRVMPRRKVRAVDDGSATSAVVTNVPQGQMVTLGNMLRAICKTKGRSNTPVILVDDSGDTDLTSPDQLLSGRNQVSTELIESSVDENQGEIPDHSSLGYYQLIDGIPAVVTPKDSSETYNWSQPLAKRDAPKQNSEFQMYLEAFDVAQSNSSELLLPFLHTMMENTNSSIVHDAAWSIYSDMTNSNELVLGPFLYGMNCLDWLEDQIFGNSTNSPYSNSSLSFLDSNSTADLTDMELSIVVYLASHQVLLDLYNYVWTNGQTAIEKTGLSNDMDTLLTYLLPTNQSVMTDGFLTEVTKSNDDAYPTSKNYNITTKDPLDNIIVY